MTRYLFFLLLLLPSLFFAQDKAAKAQAIQDYGESIISTNTQVALDTLQSSLQLWKETEKQPDIAYCYNLIGNTYGYMGNNEKSITAYNNCLTILEKVDDEPLKAIVLFNRSLQERYLSNYGDALESTMQSLKIATKLKDTTLMTNALLGNGFNYMLAKRFPEAIEAQEQALTLFKLQKNTTGEATVYNDLGVTSIVAENYEEALDYHKNALALRKKLNDKVNTGNSYAYIAVSYKRMGKYREALTNGKEALKYHLESGETRYIVDTYINLGDNYLKLQEYKNAIASYQDALEVAKKYNDTNKQALCLMLIGEVQRNAGNLKESISYLKQADNIVAPNDFNLRLELYENLTKTYVKDNDYKNAYEAELNYGHIKDSLDIVEKADKIETLKQQLIYDNKEALQKASQDKQIALKESQIKEQKLIRNLSILGLLIGAIFAFVFFWRFKEKRKLNVALNKTLSDLKSTQTQLIQSEKMASLGELTAGIAHEIQNPLNFVNNFSEVSNEMIDEMNVEIEKGDLEEVKFIMADIKSNLEKINHHGKRADAIVKGMLQHSRKSSAEKEPTDINKLADEYLRLAYHGLRAKDKSFNATLETDYDKNIGKISVIPQDMGRVILNLITNAFYAVNEQVSLASKGEINDYEPTVTVSTKKLKDKVEITVKDNGNGIPQSALDKIFLPFFTTKPTGEGTGLGLSMSYDIVTKAHGGEIRVETEENKGTTFCISLPLLKT